MQNLNKYQIKWAIITPLKGIVRKDDAKKLNTFVYSDKKHCAIHAPDHEMLMSKLNGVKGKLNKSYQVVIITDAQFGNVKGNDFESVYTAKQISERFTI